MCSGPRAIPSPPGSEHVIACLRRRQLVNGPLGRRGDYLLERAEELAEVRSLEMAIKVVEALPFLDEDETVRRLDV
jgi:hypothetical protein